MAHKTPVARWLFERKERLDLKLTEFRWGKSLATPIYDIEARITLNGKTVEGRGTSTLEHVALEKAGAEAIERFTCISSSMSTEGVAAHVDADQSKMNAELEALERFLFSWHQKNRVSFRSIKPENDYDNVASLISQRAKVQFRSMNAPQDYFALVCKITDETHSFIGLSCDKNLNSAFEKSFLEAARNLSAQKANPDSFALAVQNNPDLWCGNNQFIQKLDPLFSGQLSNAKPPTFEIFSKHLPLIKEFQECPLHLGQAWVEVEQL